MNDGSEHVDLIPDAAASLLVEGDGVVSVSGLLGESSDEDSVRIYLDTAFNTFYDIPKQAVQDRHRVDAADSPFGVPSTVLHIRQGTRITVQHTSSRTIDHEFLAGDFTAPGSFRALTSFQRPGTANRQVAWAAGYNTNPNDCYPTSPRGGGCRSDIPFCPI
jgi:hypothetical protein